jgi:hypothetical protein
MPVDEDPLPRPENELDSCGAWRLGLDACQLSSPAVFTNKDYLATRSVQARMSHGHHVSLSLSDRPTVVSDGRVRL